MKAAVIILIYLITFNFLPVQDFLSEQKKYERVRSSIKQKGNYLKKKLNEIGLLENNLNILITAYKDEDVLEVFAKTKQDVKYKLLAVYKICTRSGVLGPKRCQGDLQVPEGFYHIDRFNPASNFYLSLGINYPNKSDLILKTGNDPGGDIFIHGNCVTIGCIPVTDDKIKEIYLYAVYARNCGQTKIPVYIFPFRMTDDNFKKHCESYSQNKNLISFWSNLKIGFDLFEKEKRELKTIVNKQGIYSFKF